MAYAAVVSVAQILDQLLNTDQYPVDYPKPQVEYLYSKVCSLKSSLEKLSPIPIGKSSEVEKLESQIRDVMYRAQDTIELFISRRIRSSDSDGIGGDESSAALLLRNLGEVRADLDPITETAEEMSYGETENSYGETENSLVESALPSIQMSTGIVGLEEPHRQLMDVLLDSGKSLQVVPITGMGGIGKSTLAMSIYKDPKIKEYFDIFAWVTVSQEYNIQAVLSSILGSAEPGHYSSQGSDEIHLRLRLHRSLYERRYLIVLDDVWSASVFDELRNSFPDNKNGSRIIITSRLKEIGEHARSSISHLLMNHEHALDSKDEKFVEHAESSISHHVMGILDAESSWRLLCKQAFGDGSCPPHLLNTGWNIARNCQGIPLYIVVVGGLLSQGPKTEEYWKSIEEEVYGAAAVSKEDSNLSILYLSYKHLPSRLKACFLYMAAFQEDSEILISKLVNLWVAEGFLTHPSPPQTLEQVAKQHLEDLIHRNVIMISKLTSGGQPKTCRIHDTLLQVAVQECQKDSFFHAIRRYTQEELPQGTKTQRRISIHNNILLCSEDVYNCTKSIEYARTLVYAGPDLLHPLPHCLTFELLRVLDALSVYFIELPDALFELVHLRYLAFTYDEDIPQSISKLQNLLILIIRQHPNIMFKRISNLPDEIWNMPQIRHLLFTECFLPDPCVAQTSVFFENLQSLSNVNVACCTREILQNMPNLKKLCTWIEGPDVVVQFDLDQLQHLETFKFTVMKPIPGSKIEFHPKLCFPKTVRKLSLSGCGLPWEDMKVIAELPDLQVLKLREFAFHGQVWCPDSYMFRRLRFLLLESLDLENLDADDSHFPVLERLIIKHCYQLKEINSEIGSTSRLVLIELVDCSPNVVASVQHLKEEREELYGESDLQVRIYSSLK